MYEAKFTVEVTVRTACRPETYPADLVGMFLPNDGQVSAEALIEYDREQMDGDRAYLIDVIDDAHSVDVVKAEVKELK